MNTYKLTEPTRGNLDIEEDGRVRLMSYPGEKPEFVWKADSLEELVERHPDLKSNRTIRELLDHS